MSSEIQTNWCRNENNCRLSKSIARDWQRPEEPRNQQEDNKYPEQNDRDGEIPFLWLSALPHIHGVSKKLLPEALRDEFNRQGHHQRQYEEVVQISQYRYEIRDKVNRRQRICNGDSRQNLCDDRSTAVLECQEYSRNLIFQPGRLVSEAAIHPPDTIEN